MSFYKKEVNRISKVNHSNKGQIETVMGTRNFINNNFEKELNLDLLSHIQFTSKFHLLRLFKKYYGLTIRQYLIEIRLKKSKEFLSNGMSVTQTCIAVGYKSPSSFSNLFKRKTGLTPIIFQKKQFSTS
jgi:AraC-like DNA-binding protein